MGRKKVNKSWKVGDRVEIPEVKGQKFAGMEMVQDPRNVGKKGTIIWVEDVGGSRCPVIRLDGRAGRIVKGYECWWKLWKLYR